MILAVDPGIRGCGVAVFSPHGLLAAQYVTNPTGVQYRSTSIPAGERDDTPSGFRVYAMAREVHLTCPHLEAGTDTLVLEFPRIYREAKQGKKDPNDLTPLAAIDGAIMGLFGMPAIMYYPHAWKGSLDPDICISRVRSRLTEDEWEQVQFPKGTCEDCRDYEKAAVACAKSSCLAHNVFDAIGIGLKYTGRFDARRVYAR